MRPSPSEELARQRQEEGVTARRRRRRRAVCDDRGQLDGSERDQDRGLLRAVQRPVAFSVLLARIHERREGAHDARRV